MALNVSPVKSSGLNKMEEFRKAHKLDISVNDHYTNNVNPISLLDGMNRRNLIIMRLLELLRQSNLSPSLYEDIVNEKFFTDEEILQISEELKVPLFRYISNGRCEREFERISLIGKGGFGSVHRMKHRIDGNEYAIKKIKLTFKNREDLQKVYNSVIREVQTLASADHANIVRYNSCWFETVNKFKENDTFNNNNNNNCNNNNKNKKNNDIVKEELELQFQMDESYNEHSVESEPDDYDSSDDIMYRNKFFNNDYNWNSNEVPLAKSPEQKIGFEFDVDVDDDGNNVVGVPASPGRFESYMIENNMGNLRKLRNFEELPLNLDDNKMVHVKRSSTPSLLNIMFNEKKKRYEIYLYIQMQLCSTYTLEDYLWSEERVKSQKIHYKGVLGYLQQIVQALMHIHSNGLIHRDVKPANLFLGKDSEELKLGDFGLAKKIRECQGNYTPYTPTPKPTSPPASPNPKITNKFDLIKRENTPPKYIHTTNIGTISYASPEQLNDGHYDEKVDIYSVGIILYELLRPFSTKSERVVEIKKLRNTGKVSEIYLKENYIDEVKIIEKCLNKDPFERPTAKEIWHYVDCKYRSQKYKTFIGNDLKKTSSLEKDNIIFKQQNEILALKKKIIELQKEKFK